MRITRFYVWKILVGAGAIKIYYIGFSHM